MRKYTEYENIAAEYIEKNITDKEQRETEKLKTLISIFYTLQDIDETAMGIMRWLFLIFILLITILIKIW